MLMLRQVPDIKTSSRVCTEKSLFMLSTNFRNFWKFSCECFRFYGVYFIPPFLKTGLSSSFKLKRKTDKTAKIKTFPDSSKSKT